MNNDPVVIVSYARTPMGNLQGVLKAASATDLGAIAIKASLQRVNIHVDDVSEVLMGCVLSAGQGQAPARQASLKAGLPYHVGCTTINKMCGSGMKAVMLAHDMLLANSHHIIVAGGQESMTNAPYLLLKARAGHYLGHQQCYDHMFLDGLEDAYDKGRLMGGFAEATAQEYNFTRAQQDEFTIQSLKRAQDAIKTEKFIAEIAPVLMRTSNGNTEINVDENPTLANFEKITRLKPAFAKGGTVTAANSSCISDGAAALVLMRLSEAKRHGLEPKAKIVTHSTHAHEPCWFATAPIHAIEKVVEQANWQINDVDLFEINEAFAVVTMAAMHDLELPIDKVNIYGGACALGHPIGASGARIIATLLNALEQCQLQKGVAALCIGGGEATAIAVERFT